MDGGQVRGYSPAAVCSRLFKLRMFVMIQQQQEKLPEPQKRETKMADWESPLFRSINTYLDFVEKTTVIMFFLNK